MTSKSTSWIIPKQGHISSFIVPAPSCERRPMREHDEMTNEIESQCPQMMALFESSHVGTDENLSQLRFDKSDICDNACEQDYSQIDSCK